MDRCADNRQDLHVHMPGGDAPNAYSREWADACDRAHDLIAGAPAVRTQCDAPIEAIFADLNPFVCCAPRAGR
jgi:hypothetical protein